MNRIEVVTTFSNDGYDCYGRLFVRSFLQFEQEAHLVVYHESLPSVDLIADNLTWRNLDHDADRKKFIADHGSDPEKVSDERFPNRQSIRFCHKVFALTHAAHHSMAEWLVWMDADVVVHGKPDWNAVLPPYKSLSFLGRPRYAYTECGFVGYRIGDPRVRELLADMRRYYTTGEIFTKKLDDRHDSRCFDICRGRSGIPADQQHSISASVPSVTHVWPQTPLQGWSTHNKGPGRKRGAYGSFVP